jgi:uncharacterized protein (DUF488 family)
VKRIYTLGTSRRTEEDFMEILQAFGIECLIDVRHFPKSRLPHFSREVLEDSLAKNGIEYRWLGKELGGFRKGGYESYTQTPEFSRGIDALEEVASGRTSVVVCAERFPWKCHRRWIARELHRRGWLVEHILEKDKVWIPGEHGHA